MRRERATSGGVTSADCGAQGVSFEWQTVRRLKEVLQR